MNWWISQTTCSASQVLPSAGVTNSSRASEKSVVMKLLVNAEPSPPGWGRCDNLPPGSINVVRQHHDHADLLVVGKNLSGGIAPCAGIAGKDEILGDNKHFASGSTFAGTPAGCAAGLKTLELYERLNLVENAARMGAYFLDGLRQIDNPQVKEVRGRGLMIAVEFDPAAGGARQYCERLQAEGILCKETHEHTLRFAPPLVITKEDIDEAIEVLDECLAEEEKAMGLTH